MMFEHNPLDGVLFRRHWVFAEAAPFPEYEVQVTPLRVESWWFNTDGSITWRGDVDPQYLGYGWYATNVTRGFRLEGDRALLTPERISEEESRIPSDMPHPSVWRRALASAIYRRLYGHSEGSLVIVPSKRIARVLRAHLDLPATYIWPRSS